MQSIVWLHVFRLYNQEVKQWSNRLEIGGATPQQIRFLIISFFFCYSLLQIDYNNFFNSILMKWNEIWLKFVLGKNAFPQLNRATRYLQLTSERFLNFHYTCWCRLQCDSWWSRHMPCLCFGCDHHTPVLAN